MFTWSQATQHLELADAFAAPISTDPPDCAGWVREYRNGGSRSVGEDYDSPEWVQACLEAGADPNARDAVGDTPLHYAIDRGEVAVLLLAAGADPNARNNRGETPLHSSDTGFEVVVLLLEAGADPNARDQDGETPLHYAYHHVSDDSADMERALIRAGADPNLPYESGRPYRCITFECMAKKTYRMER